MDYKYKNGDKVSINLANFFSAFEFVEGEFYQDDDGNVEIYIPEAKQYTSFYVKLPKFQKGIDK